MRRKRFVSRPVLVDALEARRMLSAGLPAYHPRVPRQGLPRSTHSVTLKAAVPTRNTAAAAAAPTDVVVGAIAAPAATPDTGPGAIAPFTPAKLRRFYNADDISFNGAPGSGAGETIAIIDAYNTTSLLPTTDPNFAGSDLAVFDKAFGLPDPPSFLKVPGTSGAALPAATSSAWGIESCLDVEWAHAMAPMANIVLFEASSDSFADLVLNAAVTAGKYAGVVVVSMSFTDAESESDLGYDNAFVSGAQPVTFVASTGDQGAGSTGYPSLSPNVVAVGGTSITTSDSAADYGSETVWNDSYGATGGAPSALEPRPAYQSGLTIAGTTRTTPDVSFDADPGTGAYVYDSTYGGGGWYKVGGTSLSAPCWAGLIAVADQGRATLGLRSIDGATVTLPRLYALPSTDFNDITTGSNGYGTGYGYAATVGYDLATGLGTPIANLLVPDLAGGATVTGRVYRDNNADDVYDGNDVPIQGQQVYIDLNNDGKNEPGEPVTFTNAAGIYTFTDQAGHESGTVRLVSSLVGGAFNYIAVPGSGALNTSFGATQTIDIGYYPTLNATAIAGDAYSLRLDPTGTLSQVLLDGTVIQSAPVSLATTLSFSLNGPNESLTVDASNGNPIPAGGITVTGTTGGADTLTIAGSSGADSYAVAAGSVVFSGRTITESNVSSLTLNPGTGTNSLSVASGSATISPVAAGGGILTRTFSSIAIGSTGSLAVATAAARSDRTLVLTSSLSIAAGGQLDLGGNDMVLEAGGVAGLTGVTALAATGDSFGNWNGPGLASSAAAADKKHLTALGVAPGSVIPAGKTFDGYTPAAGDVLVKYTSYGDTNLDGNVDGSDYSRIDVGYAAAATGWVNGDFNYDSAVDGTDYTLIDNAFNGQTAGM
jgi:hypothetical protein